MDVAATSPLNATPSEGEAVLSLSYHEEGSESYDAELRACIAAVESVEASLAESRETCATEGGAQRRTDEVAGVESIGSSDPLSTTGPRSVNNTTSKRQGSRKGSQSSTERPARRETTNKRQRDVGIETGSQAKDESRSTSEPSHKKSRTEEKAPVREKDKIQGVEREKDEATTTATSDLEADYRGATERWLGDIKTSKVRERLCESIKQKNSQHVKWKTVLRSLTRDAKNHRFNAIPEDVADETGVTEALKRYQEGNEALEKQRGKLLEDVKKHCQEAEDVEMEHLRCLRLIDASRNLLTSLLEDWVCPICQWEVSNLEIVILRCNHIICLDCCYQIPEGAKDKEDKKPRAPSRRLDNCPMCREPLTPDKTRGRSPSSRPHSPSHAQSQPTTSQNPQPQPLPPTLLPQLARPLVLTPKAALRKTTVRRTTTPRSDHASTAVGFEMPRTRYEVSSRPEVPSFDMIRDASDIDLL